MILQQISVFQPTKFAYFPNSQIACVQIHANLQYIAFSTRNNQLILHNKKTGRTSNLFKSEHGIVDIKFTTDLLIIVEKGYHQIICFSLKTEKIKKKITGNRSQILRLSYCRQKGLFAIITNDTCAIYNQFTLSREKILKCSSSTFCDCHFSLSGQYLFTAFKDSTFFIWSLDDYSYEQYPIQDKKLKICSNYSSYICVYSDMNIFVADLSKQIVFERLDKFWDTKIQRVDFIQNIIIIQTQSNLYIADLSFQHRFLTKNVKAVEGSVTTFRVGGYGSMILLLSNNAKKISCLHIIDENKRILGIPKNPLQNEGLYCCGGYSNINGCTHTDNMQMTQMQGKQSSTVETLSKNVYNQTNSALFSMQKFQEFLSKHHIFPDKHRASAYKFLLQLPINPQQFLRIQQKGWHESVQFLDKKYPLENKRILQTMKNILSWLAWVDPLYGQWENTPLIVFPFVCMFGQDEYLCFQILYRLFTNFLSFLYDEFPVANSKFLQNVYQILEETDPQMIRHLKDKNITFTKLSWSMLSNFFTTNLPKQAFLAVVDNLVVRPKQPQFIIFIILGYLSYNRSRILSANNQKDLDVYLEQQHTVNTGKFMKYVFSYQQNFKDRITYKFNTIDFNQKQYLPMNHYPKDAVKMYRGRRKLQAEQLRKQDQQELYKEKLSKQMQKMTIQAKRNSQREMIRAQSYSFHAQNEEKSRLQESQNNNRANVRLQRIRRLQKLIQELTKALKNERNAKKVYKEGMSFSISTNLYEHSDRQLQQLQLKLMRQLTNLKPNLSRPYNSIPVSSFKQNLSSSDNSNTFKALLNAQIANKMWELDSLDNINQQQVWENQMLRSMKV